MILTADVGNSRIKFALFRNESDREGAAFFPVVSSRTDRTRDELADILERQLRPLVGDEALEGAIVGSVVPALTSRVAAAIRMTFPEVEYDVLTVRPGLRTGIDIRTDYQSELGADIIANAVAARAITEPPFAVVDLGTAITVSFVDGKGLFQGVAIAPGIAASARALDRDCAALTYVDALDPEALAKGAQALGKNTASSVSVGLLCSAQAMIESTLKRIEDEFGLDAKLPVVVCGGDFALPLSPERRYVRDEMLTSKGLLRLWSLNSKAKK